MILIVNICKEKLHYYEFVQPVCGILDGHKINYFVKDYKAVNRGDLDKCEKVIICGTSLYDNEFAMDLKYFKWITHISKPLLGICGGMQIIGMVFGGKLKKKTEIGYYPEYFKNNFLGASGKKEVYHLHNNRLEFNKLEDFEIYCKSEKVVQAVKHRNKEIYGVLFHPEVRNKDLIIKFCS
jgi:GMP synthase-like glutamine amidotransferase